MTNWESPEKIVSKKVLSKDSFTEAPIEAPTERATCRILIGNLSLTHITVADLEKEFYSDLLIGSPEKMIVLGDSCTKLDRQIERAIKTMFINEKSLVTIRPSSLVEVGDEKVLVKFEITLLGFEPFKQISEWTPKEKYEISVGYKEAGVHLFESARYRHAFYMFAKACKLLISLEVIKSDELEETLLKKVADLRIVIYNNMAGCRLSRKCYEHAISLSGLVLELDKNNVKALHQRGVAYGCLENYEKALADFKKVLSIEPENSLAREKFDFYNNEEIVKQIFGSDE